MSKKVVVIGGGIIGLCSAYYLQKEGHEVTVIDQSNLTEGASYVNAGYLAPSHFIPLAAPGVMKKGIKWMFNPSSPLFIKPRFNLEFLQWAWAFNKSCNPKHVTQSVNVIKDISVLSQELYDDLKKTDTFRFHYEKRGLFMLCQTEKMLESEIKLVTMAQELGLDASEVSLSEITSMEPNAKFNIKGATYYKCDAHTTPHEFMEDMKAHLRNVGVTFYLNEKVTDLKMQGNKVVSIVTETQQVLGDEFVLAAGSWSSLLSKKVGCKLLLQAGKGYRINTERETGITIPAILAEAKVAVTPMNGFTRFAGTMEVAGINHTINKTRVEAIAQGVQNYYPDIEITLEEKNDAAAGLRPVTPDGLPYIGKTKKCSNATLATGHAMMGWSMATATGKVVSEIISERKPSLDMNPYNPDRTF